MRYFRGLVWLLGSPGYTSGIKGSVCCQHMALDFAGKHTLQHS